MRPFSRQGLGCLFIFFSFHSKVLWLSPHLTKLKLLEPNGLGCEYYGEKLPMGWTCLFLFFKPFYIFQGNYREQEDKRVVLSDVLGAHTPFVVKLPSSIKYWKRYSSWASRQWDTIKGNPLAPLTVSTKFFFF